MFTRIRLLFFHVALAAALTAASTLGQAGERPVSESSGRAPLAYRVEGSPFKPYYERVKMRIDHAMAANPPTRAGSSMRGSTVVKFAVSETGALEGVSTEQATSPDFAQYAVRLVSSLAPFEQFSVEMRKRTNRIDVSIRIAH